MQMQLLELHELHIQYAYALLCSTGGVLRGQAGVSIGRSIPIWRVTHPWCYGLDLLYDRLWEVEP